MNLEPGTIDRQIDRYIEYREATPLSVFTGKFPLRTIKCSLGRQMEQTREYFFSKFGGVSVGLVWGKTQENFVADVFAFHNLMALS